jgi:hypothetical protein
LAWNTGGAQRKQLCSTKIEKQESAHFERLFAQYGLTEASAFFRPDSVEQTARDKKRRTLFGTICLLYKI